MQKYQYQYNIIVVLALLFLVSSTHMAYGYWGSTSGGAGTGGGPGTACGGSSCNSTYHPGQSISGFSDTNGNGVPDTGEPTHTTTGGSVTSAATTVTGGGTPKPTLVPGKCEFIGFQGITGTTLTLPPGGFHGSHIDRDYAGNSPRLSWSATVQRVAATFTPRTGEPTYYAYMDTRYSDTLGDDDDGISMTGPNGRPYPGLYRQGNVGGVAKKSTVRSPEYIEMPSNAPLGEYTITTKHITTPNVFGGYTCVLKFTLVPTVVPKQCSDNKDNDGDDLIDDNGGVRDPGCYVQGRTNDPTKYNPNDDDESNTLPDLEASFPVASVGTVTQNSRVIFSGKVKNISTRMWAPTNTAKLYIREVGKACSNATGAWLASRVCEKLPNGVFYHNVGGVRTDYDPAQVVSLSSMGVLFPTVGRFQVCLRADANNEVNEESESNIRCLPEFRVVAGPGDTTPPDPTPTDPLPECSDGRDNSDPEDSLADAADPDCTGPDDPSETATPTGPGGGLPPGGGPGGPGGTPGGGLGTPAPQCSNSVNDDPAQDGLVDAADPGCWTDPSDPTSYNPNNPSETLVTYAPLTLMAPNKVRKGTYVTIAWNTGGRTHCTMNASYGYSSSVLPPGPGSYTTKVPLMNETTFTLSCTDDGQSLQKTIAILPTFQEI